jgi:hypothetical protein
MEPFAKPYELDYQLAYRAHARMSHVPDERAKQEQAGYVNAVNSFAEEMFALAKTEDQQRIYAEEMERYKENYLKHYALILPRDPT